MQEPHGETEDALPGPVKRADSGAQGLAFEEAYLQFAPRLTESRNRAIWYRA